MMRIKVLIPVLIVTFFATATVFGQTGRQVKVRLKNGVLIKGAVLKSFDDRSVEVSATGTMPIVIRYEYIRNISFKGYGSISGEYETKLNEPPKLKTNAFFHEIRGGLLFGEESTSGLIHTINGYQFNKYLGTGLGIGVNKYGNYLTMPIYASVKGYLFDKKVTPFYFGDVGYGFAWRTNRNDDVFEVDHVQGGYYWQVGVGYQVNFYGSSVVLALGYSHQDSTVEYVFFRPWDIDDVEVSERRVLRRFALSIGFLF